MLERSENIISAVVHLDEETPHMHLVYIPVVHLKDSKSGKILTKYLATNFGKAKIVIELCKINFMIMLKKMALNLKEAKF